LLDLSFTIKGTEIASHNPLTLQINNPEPIGRQRLKFKVSVWVQLTSWVFMPVFICLVHLKWIEIVWDLIYLAFMVFFVALIFRGLFDWAKGDGLLSGYYPKNLRLLPDCLVFISNLKRDAFPCVTITFILINTLIFFSPTCLRPPGCMDEISRMTR
jgi:hypothetical protein